MQYGLMPFYVWTSLLIKKTSQNFKSKVDFLSLRYKLNKGHYINGLNNGSPYIQGQISNTEYNT